MTRKRFVSLFLALVLVMTSLFVIVGCDNNKNDASVNEYPTENSFTGAISAESYSDANAAASAFVANEINGRATNATFVSYAKDKDLTADEIAKLDLGEGYSASDVDSAESGNVTYTEKGAKGRAAAASSENKTSRMYIIRIGDYYFYYVPIFKKGELITKSYISDILDWKKYANVTETSVSTTTMSVQGETLTTSVSTVVKITENGVYSKMSTEMFGEVEYTEMYLILQKTEDGKEKLTAFISYGEDSEWISGSIEYDTVEDFLEESFNFDHTYFERSDYGFKMSSEKLSQYVSDVLQNTLEAFGAEITAGDAKYYVVDGKLSSSDVEMSMSVEYMGVSASASVKATCEWTDFGTTVIEIPDEIKAMLSTESEGTAD